MGKDKTFGKESVKTVGDNYHGIANHKAKGVTSKAMKQVGRNVARARNQRGK
jgi:hypothetical protein